MAYNPGGKRVDAPVLGITTVIDQETWRRLARLGEFKPASDETDEGEAGVAQAPDRNQPTDATHEQRI